MATFTGLLSKMRVSLVDNTAQYIWPVDTGEPVLLNDFIGKVVKLEFLNELECIACHKRIKKTYQNGYCFPCTQKLASCDFCILSPDRCHFHKGTCREPEWAKKNCFREHYIYLANTSGLKVGLTRDTQVPIRWIDQGAIQALKIAKVKSRYQAGLLEKSIAMHVADKTNWRHMLKAEVGLIDLAAKRDELFTKTVAEIQDISSKFDFGDIELLTNEKVQEIHYPYTKSLEKIKSVKLDKVQEVNKTLIGIKGQYLIFEDCVLNVRSHTGYISSLSV